MGVTVLPYIDQTQTARLQEAASANIQTPKNKRKRRKLLEFVKELL